MNRDEVRDECFQQLKTLVQDEAPLRAISALIDDLAERYPREMITKGLLRDMVKDARREIAETQREQTGLGPDSDHAELAEELVKRKAGEGVVFVGGYAHRFNPRTRVWDRMPDTYARQEATNAFKGAGFLNLKKGSDYGHVQRIWEARCDATQAFLECEVGVAVGSRFYRPDGTWEPLSARHMQTARIEIEIEGEEEPEEFLAMLRRHLIDGEEAVQLMGEAIGCSILGTLGPRKKAVMSVGEKDTGKSTVITLLEELFPPLWRTSIEMSRFDRDNYIARLAGVRLNTNADLDPGAVIPGASVKKLTGGDSVEGRQLYKASFSFKPRVALWNAGNRLPSVSDYSGAFYHRFFVFAFGNPISSDEQREGYAKELLQREGGRIVAWAIRCAVRSAEKGFTKCEAMDRRAKSWLTINNSVADWLDDPTCIFACTSIQVGGIKRSATGAELYEAYRHALQAHDTRRPIGRNKFFEELRSEVGRDRGISQGGDDTSGTRWFGIVRKTAEMMGNKSEGEEHGMKGKLLQFSKDQGASGVTAGQDEGEK